MTRVRVLLFFLGILVVGFLGYLAVTYAKGYRLDFKTLKFVSKGILVVKTDPTGAQVFVDRDLIGASDSNFSLSPGTYDVEIKKNEFIGWYKRLVIEKETVTEVDVNLFKSSPSFVSVTQGGVSLPAASINFSQIAYAAGDELWILENINFPIGFAKDPRKITDGNLTGATWQFSPDGRELLLNTSGGSFILDTGKLTPQAQRINISSKKDTILETWRKEKEVKLSAQGRNLPAELQDLLQRKAGLIVFSPDEMKILYTASQSGTLSTNLIKPIPGASTQKENRDIKIDHTYVYDIKEDRNFLIDSTDNWEKRTLFWLPNSRNLVLGDEGKISIMDYDGTNKQLVFSGSYTPPYVFPYLNGEKLLILTNLGADSQTPNLYSISIK
ncbi:MAG: PEGA domain-containing protein [Patescibacteria group bacterium]